MIMRAFDGPSCRPDTGDRVIKVEKVRSAMRQGASTYLGATTNVLYAPPTPHWFRVFLNIEVSARVVSKSWRLGMAKGGGFVG